MVCQNFINGIAQLAKKKNLFAEPASTLEHYRRNVLMYSGVEGRALGGSVMAFSVFRTNQHWFLSVLWDAIRFISRQTSCKETGKREQWWRGIFPDPDAALMLWALSGYVSSTWVKIWTLSWNLCEDVFRSGYRGMGNLLAPGMGSGGEELWWPHIPSSSESRTTLYTSLWINITCSGLYFILIMHPEIYLFQYKGNCVYITVHLNWFKYNST